MLKHIYNFEFHQKDLESLDILERKILLMDRQKINLQIESIEAHNIYLNYLDQHMH